MANVTQSLGFDASLIVDTECLDALDPVDRAAANSFAEHMFGAFRFDSMSCMFLYTLLSTALAYASSVPTPNTRFNAVLYWVWNLCYLVQVACAVTVVVTLGMSAARLNALIEGCGARVNGWHIGISGVVSAGIFGLVVLLSGGVRSCPCV